MSVESPDILSLLTSLSEGMRRLELQVASFRESPAVPKALRTHFTVKEAAKMLDKSDYTVRQWALEGRINAIKRVERRGGAAVWNIAADEIERIRNYGFLTRDPRRNDRN